MLPHWRENVEMPVKQNDMMALAEYQRKLWKQPRLRYLFLELTDSCNLNCCHCGSRCTAGKRTFLPISIIHKVLTEVATSYRPYEIMVCITGGEPFLHPDLYGVISIAHQMGFACGITTNGTLIDENAAKKAALAGLDTVAVSIDGLRQSHDAFRGMAGAFDRAMRGVKNLRKYGIDAQAMTVVHSGNIEELGKIHAFLSRNSFSSWRLTNIDPIGRAREQEALLLSGKELKRMFDFIRSRRFDPQNDMEVTYGCAHFTTYMYEREVRDFYFQCGAGTMVGSVMANGDIGACLDIERRPDLVQGNIYAEDFVTVWENRFRQFRKDRGESSPVCKSCKYEAVCMGDSAHTWDYDDNRPLYCIAGMMEER